MTEQSGSLEVIKLFDIPKFSLNKFYSGRHWWIRKQLKDDMVQVVRAQTTRIITKPCEVEYVFTWKTRIMDPSNTVAMVKMIEDCIFADDSYKIVKKISMECQKGLTDSVLILITYV